jgi:hypothetical protein
MAKAAAAWRVASVHTMKPILGGSLCDWIDGVTGYNPAALSIPKVLSLDEVGPDVVMTYQRVGENPKRVRICAANLAEVRYEQE